MVFQCPDNDTWCCATGNPNAFVRNYNFTCCDKQDLTMQLGPAVFFGTAAVSIGISTLVSSTAVAASTGTQSTGVTTSNAQQPSVSTIDAGSFSIPSTTQSQSSSAAPSSTVTEEGASSSSKPLAIGLGVGIPVGLILIALLSFFFFRLGRRQSQRDVIQEKDNYTFKTAGSIVPPYSEHSFGGHPEGLMTRGYEMDGQGPKVEMAGQGTIPIELEGRHTAQSPPGTTFSHLSSQDRH
ncbi:hypothetical protein JX265_006751 [Neoarthrinium moseri]|uniref:Uncharacterized protein n=1 Tax=Neoarthrinium moseri TaxID=1658444 RepID=A0A9P9WKR9_9PEZI|nr:hypothetical protein JX266_006930 [Neoarthrinium moseri]KAI1868772.1 hypothetical protein JX265_006751 [Neoarthrinium moseri]